MNIRGIVRGNSLLKLRDTRSVSYSVELVVLNNHQISGSGVCLVCYLVGNIFG